MFALSEGEEGLKISILSQSIFSNMNIFLSCGHLWWFFCLTLGKKRQKRNKWLQQICEKSVVIFLFCCRNRLGKITELKGKKIVHCKSQGHHRLVLACMLEWAEKPKIQQPIHNPAYRLFRGKNPPTPCREGGSPVKSGLCGVLGVKLWIPTGLSVTDCGERCLSIALNEKCPE